MIAASRLPITWMTRSLLPLILSSAAFCANEATRPFAITVVDRASGWPVPLVELRTVHHVRFISDNAGRITFDLPELMERETWFDVTSDGYEVPADGFGKRGVMLKPEPGKSAIVNVNRT